MSDYLGKDLKKLGFGFMRLPLQDGGPEVDLEHTKKMVDLFMERGYTYFDTAVPYLGQRSEVALKAALVDRYPRESFQIATKLSINFVTEETPKEKLFANSLENIGVDYVDFYLIHAMNNGNAQRYADMGAWEFVKEMKEAGKIKHYGFSFHDKAEVLDRLLTEHPEVDFVQLQLNYADWESNTVQSRLCYEVAMKHNKPVTVMEPVKGGTLATLVPKAEEIFQKVHPDATMASWALRYAASLDNIITVLSGMSTVDQVKNNLDTMDAFTPLNEVEQKAVADVVGVLNAIPTIPCTDCKYCVKDCPVSINIPRYFNIMNLHLRYDADQSKASNQNSFNFAAKNAAKPSACVACGRCEGNCPQNIEIIDELKKIVPLYEQ